MDLWKEDGSSRASSLEDREEVVSGCQKRWASDSGDWKIWCFVQALKDAEFQELSKNKNLCGKFYFL